MFFGRKPIQKHQPIDGVVLKSRERTRAARSAEIQEQLVLAKKLGDRAMEGEEFGIPGFMAIGFPLLRPDSAEYARIVNAYHNVARMAAGSCVQVGPDFNRVIGIKAGRGKESIAFNIIPSLDHEGNDTYEVTADVLCTKAIYTHSGSEDAIIHGDVVNPHGVTFIDSTLRGPAPVRMITPHAIDNPTDGDRFADNGNPSWTDTYTERLLPSPPAIQA